MGYRREPIMRVFVAGAAGALGRRLVPLLVERGHEVVGTTRTRDKADQIRAAGAEPVLLDALDRDQVRRAVLEAKPEVIIHELTALSGSFDLRHFDAFFATTNRLRTQGTDYLIEAGQAAGVRRIVVQSYAGWPYPRSGALVKTEEEPLDEHPAANSAATLAAIKHAERATTTAPMEGIVLRYGGLYGPDNGVGRSGGQDGELLAMVRQRRLPIVGGGTGIWSFVHVDDAASATVLAAEAGRPGIYNVVDDEPAAVRIWLPYLAQLLGAKPPRHIPAWLARPLLGEHGINMMTTARGAANGKARKDLGWVPRYASWREGFRTGLG
jgi:nucleoside-diphosphate-sugar epimerase